MDGFDRPEFAWPKGAPGPGLPEPLGARLAELGTPVAVLRESALRHNETAMASLCAEAGVELAPHVKTHLSPQLIARQLAAGAWGVTVASVRQAALARSAGARRVLVANQVIAPADLTVLARWADEDAARPTADPDPADPSGAGVACWVDGAEGVALAAAAVRSAGAGAAVPVLVELGHPGGRSGVRGVAAAVNLAALVADSPQLRLAGVAGYEGTVPAGGLTGYLDELLALHQAVANAGLVAGWPGTPSGRPVVTVGGSAQVPQVAAALTSVRRAGGVPVLRSGCYLTHDHGLYARTAAPIGPTGLRPALEVWGRVLSRPEPGLALVDVGRRDVSHDSFDRDPPVPIARLGTDGRHPLRGWAVTKLADQHAFLAPTAGASELAVGDLVGLGISHPCLTFDRWRRLLVLDDADQVLQTVTTLF